MKRNHVWVVEILRGKRWAVYTVPATQTKAWGESVMKYERQFRPRDKFRLRKYVEQSSGGDS